MHSQLTTSRIGAPIAQLGEHQTPDRKVMDSILTFGEGVVSLSKTLHPNNLVLVKPTLMNLKF